MCTVRNFKYSIRYPNSATLTDNVASGVASSCSGATLGSPAVALGSLVLRFQKSSDDSSHTFAFCILYLRQLKASRQRRLRPYIGPGRGTGS